MNITKNKTKMALAATAALLIAGCTSDDNVVTKTMDKAMDTKGQCHGVNSCKGKSACATADSACKGQNSCKGKGWVAATKTECDDLGGGFVNK